MIDGHGRPRPAGAPGLAAAAGSPAAAGRGARAARLRSRSAGWARSAVAVAGAVRAGRPAAGAAAGRARARPHRVGRASGRGRRPALGQVHGAVHRSCSGLALTSTPVELGVYVLRLRRRCAGRRGRAAARRHRRRRSADPIWCGAWSPSSAPRWPGGSGCSGRPGSPRSPSSGRAGRPATSRTSRPPTCCWSSTATSRCAREFDELEAQLLPIAAKGLSYGLHLAVSANRWSELRPALQGPARRARRAATRRSAGVRGGPTAGRGGAGPARSRAGAATGRRWCWPRPGPAIRRPPPSGWSPAIAAAWPGPAFAAGAAAARPARSSTSCRRPSRSSGLPLGVDERLARVELDFAVEPHLLCFGDAECGKTALLRLLAHGICARFVPTRPGSWSSTRAARCSTRYPTRTCSATPAPPRPRRRRRGRSPSRCVAGCPDRRCRPGAA